MRIRIVKLMGVRINPDFTFTGLAVRKNVTEFKYIRAVGQSTPLRRQVLEL